jgi:hypothetical protein
LNATKFGVRASPTLLTANCWIEQQDIQSKGKNHVHCIFSKCTAWIDLVLVLNSRSNKEAKEQSDITHLRTNLEMALPLEIPCHVLPS